MAAFGIVPIFSDDCRTVTFPDVFLAGVFDVSGVAGATATVATLTFATHDGATTFTVNVLNTGTVAVTGFSVSGQDLIYSTGSATQMVDSIWNARFDYTYTPGPVTESVCYFIPITCTMKGNILTEVIGAIGNPDCIECGTGLIECSSLELTPLYDAMLLAAQCSEGVIAAEIFEFLKQRIDATKGCTSC